MSKPYNWKLPFSVGRKQKSDTAHYEFRETISRLLRSGYIKGQEDYASGNQLGAIILNHTSEREGWHMGYNAANAVKAMGLQAAPLGGTWNG